MNTLKALAHRYRGGLIYTAIFITLGTAWIGVTICRHLVWWMVIIGSLLIAGCAQVGERTVCRRLDRRARRARRRAHARPAPLKTTRKTPA
ncbi:MAG: hypothetical protein HOY79_04375 [Streptomyces sp.]|nr:hypothetical protein [Streptomyces sp.]NUS15441.1 hypothetical protein [Streptomyces sp.]NUS24101.1 hypothetical protein [Streptomyces sp.]